MGHTFQYDDVPEVMTEAGKVHGYLFDDVYIFKGIPYAQAKRFQMPEKVTPWEGVFDACSYGFACPLLAESIPNGELLVPHRYWARTEHCQNLNIWTKELEPNGKKPVIVWIHGGAFSAGSSIEQIAFDGSNMCKYGDVVVVSVNHRVNILGYLDLSPFGEKYYNSANAGHADLVAALRWIRDNIQAFGGDPDNVTLMGQSGGGMKIAGLMQIPSADGLFHKAIMMSGVSDGMLLPEPTDGGYEIVNAMLKELGLSSSQAEKLETIPYETLAQAYNKVSPAIAKKNGYVGCSPMPNDYYLGEPLITGFRDHAKTIPVLVGSVFGEFAFEPTPYNKQKLSEDEVNKMLGIRFGKYTDKMLELFQKAYPDKASIDLLVLDRIFRIPAKALARLHAQGEKAATYLYEFTLDFPYQHGKSAWHCSDIPFFFHNTDKVEVCNIEGVNEKLEENMFQAVIHFARKGDPNHETLPEWNPVTLQNEPTMIFDRKCEVRNNFDDELLNLYNQSNALVNPLLSLEEEIQY